MSWINWFWVNQSCLYFQKNCLYFIPQKKKTPTECSCCCCCTTWGKMVLYIDAVFPSWMVNVLRIFHPAGPGEDSSMSTCTQTHMLTATSNGSCAKIQKQANAQWLAHPAVVRERTRQSSNGEQLQGRCAEKFMTHRWHLHHVNTTDKMFLSVAGQKRSSFMADMEQNQWVGEPFKAGLGPDAWVQVRAVDLCSQVTA